MHELGQILFVFGIAFTVMGIGLRLKLGRVEGAVGPVMMIIGGLLWLG